ncbi:MAG: AbrB/MazE/SpoVT family DNA-binding domain-containing protein [Candidatus Latescibacteria bacterium]|nr:AbrB/MazE/SpoVT family DNA-binding domain-containing protein [Candidatus Latescibacterota bacterium]
MPIAKVGRRGQMTLPREVRKALDVEEGDHIVFVRRRHEFSVQPLNRTLLDLRGSVRVSGRQDFDAVREHVRRTRARRGADGTS